MFRAVTELFKIISVITMIKVIRMNRVLTMLGASTLILNEANVPHYFLSITLNVGGIKFRATCIRTKTLPQSQKETFGFSI